MSQHFFPRTAFARCMDCSKLILHSLTYLVVFTFAFQATAQVTDVKLDFSEERGFHDAPFNLTITSTDPSATIRYTLDGEEPSPTSGTIYTGSIPVETTTVLRAIGYSPGVDTSKVYTHSYLYIDDVINQPENIAGWPNNRYDLGGSGTAVHDYEMDPDIVNSSRYRDDLVQGLKDIPSMSIVMPRGDFWDIYDGEVERKMSVELLYADDATLNEQEDGGIEPHSHHRLKRSMRISFKEEFGAKDWDSDIFRNATVGSETAENEFDRLVLRAGNNRAWSRNWNEDRTAFTRDEWFRQSQIAASGIGSHGTFVHLYVNGLYWGMYNPIERPDESFTSTYLGGHKDDWFAVSHAGIRSGNRSRYDYLLNDLLRRNLDNQANYEELKEYLDVEQFIDYILLSWMTGVQDWPGNNWWAGGSTSPGGPLMYFGWDNEWSWDVTRNANNGAWVHPDFRSNDTGGRNSAFVFNNAKQSDEFMMTLADRVYDICFNDGAVTDDNSRERWAALNGQIENAVVAESARWGDGIDDGVTRTRDEHWRNEVSRIDGLMDGNVDRLISALIREGYYPSLDPPLFLNNNRAIEVKDLSVNSGYSVELSNPNSTGDIYYTTNGVDPREAGGDIASTASLYTNRDLVMNQSTTLMARVKQGNEWSALHTLDFLVRQDLSWIKLTEIMYNPEEYPLSNTEVIDDAELEFLEIKNTSTSLTLDISGLQITDGVDYTFPVGTMMDPQSFIVLASNAEALAQKCPGIDILGEYEGQLSNGGEIIEFTTFDGEVIILVEYDDIDLWPTEADGEGFSLVSRMTDPVGDQNDATLWIASADNVCGSPNADDTPAVGGSDCDQNFSFNAIADASSLTVNGFSPAYVDNVRRAVAIDASIYRDEFAAATIPFDGPSGTYNLELFTMAESDGESSYRIAINGQRLNGTFTNPRIFGTEIAEYAQYSNVWTNVSLQSGDVIRVEFNSASNDLIPEGAGYAFSRGRWTGLELRCTENDSACTLIGQNCDDGDDCTINDRYDANCNCVGTLQDSDNDGICDSQDSCPNLNDNLIGASCNDGDACTTGDVYTSDCECAGEYQDSDNDGICDAEDDCHDNQVGQSCDDGDACTINDRYDANCNCVGSFQDSDNDGVCDSQDSCPDFNDNLIGTSCNDGNPCTTNDVYTSNCQCEGTFPSDSEELILSAVDDAYLQGSTRINNTELRIEENNRVTYLKFDIPTNAGTLASAELELHVGSDTGTGEIIALRGATSSWTESNLSTSNRPSEQDQVSSITTVYSAGQSYRWAIEPSQLSAGEVTLIMRQVSGNDVSFHSDEASNAGVRPKLTLTYSNNATGSSNVGATCDDGDPCTINDAIDNNCNCVGDFVDSDSDGICDAEDSCPNFDDNLVGRACDDGDACTTGDVYTSDCGCSGTSADVDGDGICAAQDQDDNDPCVPNATGADCTTDQNCSVLSTTGFEDRDMGVWNDGGRSATLLFSSSFSNTGSYSFYIQSNDGDQSSLFTSDMNLRGAEAVQIRFNVQPFSVESSESFVLEMSTGADYITLVEYVNNVDFSNGTRTDISEHLSGLNFTETTSFRFRSIGDDVADYFIFDDIVIELCQDGTAPQCQIGQACDDQDPCTTGDVYDVSCNCAGVLSDSDNDGICDAQDACPNFDDNLIGQPCDDNDACTVGERYDSNCGCSGGVYVDADQDGFCIGEDNDDSNQCVPNSNNPNCGNNGGDTDCSILSSSDFENGSGIWIDGGRSASLFSSAAFANSGIRAFYLQADNGESSSFYTSSQDYSAYQTLQLHFHLYAYLVEAEDAFVIEASQNGQEYVPIRTYQFGQDFTDGSRQDLTLDIPGSVLSSDVSLRIRSIANEISDYFVFDDISIEGCLGGDDGSCVAGSSCEDGDACTIGDTMGTNCNCISGDYVDADGDGFCLGEDADDNNPCVPDSAGCSGCNELAFNDFERNLGIWIDGGSDAFRSSLNPQYAVSGISVMRLRDNSGQASSIYTESLDLSSASSVELSFTFVPVSMERGEDFLVEVSSNGGSTFSVISEYVSGTNIENDTRYDELLVIGSEHLSQSTVIRLRCDASTNADLIYLDDVRVSVCGSRIVDNEVEVNTREKDQQLVKPEILLYPNPATDVLHVEAKGKLDISKFTLHDVMGSILDLNYAQKSSSKIEVDLNGIDKPGTYLLRIKTVTGEVYVKKFVKI